jgi:hypothetical protein
MGRQLVPFRYGTSQVADDVRRPDTDEAEELLGGACGDHSRGTAAEDHLCEAADRRVCGAADDFTLVDKIHITISVYILIDRAARSRRIDNIALVVTAAAVIALNAITISNAVISK